MEKENPDIIWLRGKIRMSSITLAMIAKNVNPNVHICVVGHSSEYYSLNKITKYLKTNYKLFNVIDSIILDDDDNTMKSLYACLEKNQSLYSVKNLLFFDKELGNIVQTPYEVSEQKIYNWIGMRRKNEQEEKIAASEVINMKLWPNSKCFWNKCTFCGINKKYDEVHYGDSFANIDDKIEVIKKLNDGGANYFWFIDEAIPPTTIHNFAMKLIERKRLIKKYIVKIKNANLGVFHSKD